MKNDKYEIIIDNSKYVIDFKKKILLNAKGEKVSKAINILRSYVSQKGISEPNSTNNHGYIGAIKKYLKGHSELDNADYSIKNNNIEKIRSILNQQNEEIIEHMALVKGWELKNNEVDGPVTLILGSFNPYFPGSETDFYYGRIAKRGEGNQFWRSIGRNIHGDKDYFQNNTELKLEAMKEFKFIFMDIIDEIKFSYPHELESSIIFKEYKKQKIIGRFGDQDIFTSDTSYKCKDSGLELKIKLQRNYNNRIIEKIKSLKSLKSIVNTMGDNDIGRFEKNTTEVSFQNFKKSLLEAISERDEIYFDLESKSPSGFAVRTEQDKNDLDVWMRKKVLRI